MITRKRRRPSVELTSLLDLLFVMIFLSLLQTKAPSAPEPKVEEKKIATPAPVEEKPKPKIIAVSAIFNFYPTPQNPSIPAGSYHMNGSFDEASGELQLGGSSWIKRPQNYDMVPLKGNIDRNTNTFRGRIEFQGCLEFTLRKETADKSFRGSWSGSYSCTQGETGLTLTIN